MKLGKLINLANSFYSLAVPLDALIQTKDMKGVPNEQVYRDYYSDIGSLYRIIYIDLNFRRLLVRSHLFNNIRKVNEVKNELKHEEFEDIRWLSDKLNPDAINIIAYRFGQDDLIGPEALDHDLAHKLFNSNKIVLNFDKFIEAWFKDYGFYLNNKDISKDIIANTESLNALKLSISEFICYMLLKNTNGVKVSDVNTEKILDVICDMAIEYNRNKSSLKHLKFSPEKAYAEVFETEVYGKERGKFSINNVFHKEKIEPDSNNSFCVEVAPKDQNLPHLNKELDNIIKYFEKSLSSYLQNLKGKVFCFGMGTLMV